MNEPNQAFRAFFETRRKSLPWYYHKLSKYLAFYADRKCTLELGCGKGDFLYLMGQLNQNALGVDLDAACVKQCLSQGLKVRRQDALQAVRQAKGRVDAIFSSNVVEHLQPAQLTQLLDLAAKALPSGGKLGLNTSNPDCIGVTSSAFWNDITHVRIYPAPLLRDLLEARGFEVLLAGPDEDTRAQGLARNLVRGLRTKLVGDYFGPPEICVMAVKK